MLDYSAMSTEAITGHHVHRKRRRDTRAGVQGTLTKQQWCTSGATGTYSISARCRVGSRPPEGWALYYLVLVLWVGSLLYRAGKLF